MTTKEKIDDLSQLKGKKIGINRLGGKSSLVLRVMLEAAGLNTTKDVTLLQLGGSQERLAALMRGGIDAAPVDFAFEPKMKQLGFHLVTGRKTPFMNAPMVVKASSVQANRGKWVRFVRAYLKRPITSWQTGKPRWSCCGAVLDSKKKRHWSIPMSRCGRVRIST